MEAQSGRKIVMMHDIAKPLQNDSFFREHNLVKQLSLPAIQALQTQSVTNPFEV